MQQLILTLKDESKIEFLVDLLSRFEFLEFKFSTLPKAKKENGSIVIKTETPKSTKLELKRGSGKGLVGPIPDDFNEPLEDFKDYM